MSTVLNNAWIFCIIQKHSWHYFCMVQCIGEVWKCITTHSDVEIVLDLNVVFTFLEIMPLTFQCHSNVNCLFWAEKLERSCIELINNLIPLLQQPVRPISSQREERNSVHFPRNKQMLNDCEQSTERPEGHPGEQTDHRQPIPLNRKEWNKLIVIR